MINTDSMYAKRTSSGFPVCLPAFGFLLAFIFLLSCGACQRGKSEGKKSGERSSMEPGPLEHLEDLDSRLGESSGLIRFRGKYWTINDSGGLPVLYSVGEGENDSIQEIEVRGAENADWESLAQDAQYIYICDVGNNYGRRQELQIYKIAKDSIPRSGNAGVIPGIIRFRYAGREAETIPFRRSRYDCEAALVWGDSLFLFTKDWENRSTTLYTCPVTPGSYELRPRRIYPSGGLVTGADAITGWRRVVLCGYLDYVPFVWILDGFDPEDYSYKISRRIDFQDLRNLQTEGVSLDSPDRATLSCERTEFPAALYRLNLEDLP